MTTRLTWTTSIGCEGGPLLVADVRDFARWPGALGTPRDKNVLQYEGFVSALPEAFRPAPGEREVTFPSGQAALQARAALRDAMVAHEPAVKVTEDDETLHFLLPGRRTIVIELGPSSEYDASWRAHTRDETWLHSWGTLNTWYAFFWQLDGGCLVDIGISAERDEIVLVQSWIDDEAYAASVRTLVETADDEVDGASLTLSSGHAAIIWSPTSVLQLTGFDYDALGWDGFEQKLRELAEQPTPAELSTDVILGLGTALKLTPGEWRSRLGGGNGDGWGCRWCRLKRT